VDSRSKLERQQEKPGDRPASHQHNTGLEEILVDATQLSSIVAPGLSSLHGLYKLEQCMGCYFWQALLPNHSRTVSRIMVLGWAHA
jgi:hypothetical protein